MSQSTCWLDGLPWKRSTSSNIWLFTSNCCWISYQVPFLDQIQTSKVFKIPKCQAKLQMSKRKVKKNMYLYVIWMHWNWRRFWVFAQPSWTVWQRAITKNSSLGLELNSSSITVSKKHLLQQTHEDQIPAIQPENTHLTFYSLKSDQLFYRVSTSPSCYKIQNRNIGDSKEFITDHMNKTKYSDLGWFAQNHLTLQNHHLWFWR